MGAPEVKRNVIPPVISLGRAGYTPPTPEQWKMFEEASAAMRKTEAEWEAAGRPWTDDQEAFLDRMTGV